MRKADTRMGICFSTAKNLAVGVGAHDDPFRNALFSGASKPTLNLRGVEGAAPYDSLFSLFCTPEGTRLRFCPGMGKNRGVMPVEPGMSNSPPDCCI